MKKRISLLLVLLMVLTMIPFGSYAEQNYDKQLKEAIKKTKEIFNIGKEYDKFSSDIRSCDDETYFYLSWEDSKGKLGGINVSITSDGIITSYDKYKPYYEETKPKLPKITKDEGLKIAENFIKEVCPQFASNIKYIENDMPLNIDSTRYNYQFVRIENNVPYYSNTIDISVDNSTGEVINYYTSWDMNLKFLDKKDIKSMEEAQKLYKEKIGLKLIYRINYDDKKPKAYLSYAPLNNSLGIDAKTGEVVEFDRYFYMNDEMGGKDESSKEGLSPDEMEAVSSVSGIMAKEEAEKVGRKYLNIDNKYELEYIGLYSNWRNDSSYIWNMSFTHTIDDKTYYSGISIDAKTGKLNSFYKDGPDSANKKPNYDEKQSLKIAEEYIKKMDPEKADSIEYIEPIAMKDKRPQKQYNFNFIRKEKEAYVLDDGIRVMVDAVEGKVIEYNLNWATNIEFPPQDNIIPLDEAYDILFNNIGMELNYTLEYIYGERTKEKADAILCYVIKPDKPLNIDANTGEILNYLGKPFKKRKVIAYKDIGNSYAKDKINILAQYGIAFESEEFKPKDKITQRDFLYLLCKASSPYYEIEAKGDDELYGYLINLGIIKEEEKAPDKKVTKEEGIKYIIRALKYDKVADISNIYKDLFKDTKNIDPKLKGYVSIAYGLNIVEGSGGYIRPKAELRREDAANMIYNYLFIN